MTSRPDPSQLPPASWRKAQIYIALGVVAGTGAIVVTGMPEGTQEHVFVFAAITSFADSDH